MTKRERQILDLLEKGLSDAEVCQKLGITFEAFDKNLAECVAFVQEDSSAFQLRAACERAQRTRLEHKLRATEARFDALVDAMLSAILVVDGRTGVIKRVNTRAEEMFGYEHGSLTNISVELLVPAQHRAIHPAYRAGFMRSIRKREMGYHPPIFALRKDGSQVEVAIALTATTSDEDVLVVCTDYATWLRSEEARGAVEAT